MDLRIRSEVPDDYRHVEALTREAFFNLHAPGCNEHYLIHVLRGAQCFIPELSLVALADEQLAGHIAYTHARLDTPDGLAVPLCLPSARSACCRPLRAKAWEAC